MQQKPAPDEKKAAGEHNDSPKFGRLLVVLLLAVALIVLLTFATEAFYDNDG